MTEKIKKLTGLLAREGLSVLVGDETLFNAYSNRLSRDIQVLVFYPTASRASLSEREVSSFRVQVLSASNYDKSPIDEVNVVERCEAVADRIIVELRCQMRVTAYAKSIVIKEYSSLMTGIELTFTA